MCNTGNGVIFSNPFIKKRVYKITKTWPVPPSGIRSESADLGAHFHSLLCEEGTMLFHMPRIFAHLPRIYKRNGATGIYLLVSYLVTRPPWPNQGLVGEHIFLYILP
jgi:hypothetical protein